MIINTNVSALFAENALNNTTNALTNLEQQMSTGYQINSPGDNPAGLAIATLMSGELGGINAAVNNANQALNLLDTANGGIQNDVQIVTQIQQLATQASNSTETTQDQQDLQKEIQSLLTQLDSNANSVNYNNQILLNGSYGATISGQSVSLSGAATVVLGADSGNATSSTYSVAINYSSTADLATVTLYNSSGTALGTVSLSNIASTATSATAQFVAGTSTDSGSSSFVVNFDPAVVSGSSTAVTINFSVAAATNPLTFQVGPNNNSANQVQTQLGSFTSLSLGLSNINVIGTSNAQNAITLANNALSMLTNAQGQIGAQQDQLNYTIQNLNTENTNLQAAKSTIMDANMSQVMSNFSREQILQQTGLQALASANQLPGLVLKLLG
ncbi:flagellin [Sulfobacillus thermosulfidooxidans]|uniref:flagellin N-terminal helical domain-containing protein n=1 Tax=Sulfobacillus thermosulfidooxidans TaxID=28034 RepID=UPI0004164587|nr:flagellin [Sulfobacillus thermosulfidooxidans]OLZ11734.1 flagellin [Sulfobacillus thermosulfidooxidans]OLZ18697.1 flagellin [Sulfobacillus thermosulfidooxidans]OLZ20224.1 flagellin [Sulfobacillus thermosulfidooxidans]